MAKVNSIFEAAIDEIKRLARLAGGPAPADKVAFAELQAFTAACERAAKDVQNEAASQAAGLPSIVRDGYTVLQYVKDGRTWDVLEMHAQEAEESDTQTPRQILETLLQNADNLQTVLVLMRDKDGPTGLVGNFTEAGDVLLFMESMKLKMLQSIAGPATGPEELA